MDRTALPRRRAQRDDDAERLRRGLDRGDEGGERRLDLVLPPQGKHRDGLVGRNGRDRERGADAEIAAASAAQAPEQVRFGSLRHGAHRAVGGDDLGARHRVRADAEAAHVEADAAAQHEARDADRRAAAMGDGAARRAKPRGDVPVEAARSDRDAAARRVIGHLLHRRQVDQEAGRGRVPGERMPAAADGEGHVHLPTPAQRLGHRLGGAAPRDRLRLDPGVAQVLRPGARGKARVSGTQKAVPEDLGESRPGRVAGRAP